MQIGNSFAITIIRHRERGAVQPLPPQPMGRQGEYDKEYDNEYERSET